MGSPVMRPSRFMPAEPVTHCECEHEYVNMNTGIP